MTTPMTMTPASHLAWVRPVVIAPWPERPTVLHVARADTPVGEVLVLAAEGRALAGVAFVTSTRSAALAGLVADLEARPEVVAVLAPDGRARLDAPARDLGAVIDELTGDDAALPVLVAGTDLTRAIARAAVAIPLGGRATYGEVAAAAGRPRAARAVGSVMARNTVPLLVPCHRVVPASGGIGAYGPGPDLKRRLLALEADAVAGRAA